MRIEQQIGYCKATNGLRVAYATYGNDDAPPLVFAADMPGQECIWASPWGRSFFEELARDRRLITVDRPGFGASHHDAGLVPPTELPGLLAQAIDGLRLETFELFAGGAGPGGTVIPYAAAHQERVSKLVLFSPKAMSSDKDLVVADAIRASFHMYRRAAATVFFPSGPADAQQWFTQASRDYVSAEQLEAHMREPFDMRDMLAELSMPVLVLHRKQSQAVRMEDVRTVASLLPHGRLVALDGDVSLPFWDFEQYAGTLREFLGIAAGPGRAPVAGGSAVILFTDIADSTALTEQLGDARFRDASRALDGGLRAAIREAGGVVVEGKLLGDGVLATFGSAAQAIEGARRCLALSAASELGLHIGVHAGDVIREEGNVFGGAVNIAARICSLSEAGEILVSDVVRGMARTSAGVVFEDRGEREMKGVGEPVRVYAVVAG